MLAGQGSWSGKVKGAGGGLSTDNQRGRGGIVHRQSTGQGLDCPRTVKGAGGGLPTDSQRGRGWTAHGQSKGQGVDCPRTVKGAGVDCPRTVKGAGVGLPTDSQRGRGWTAHGQSKGQGVDCPRTVKGAGVGLPTDSQRGRGWTAHGQSKGQGLDCPRTVKGAGVGLPTDSQRGRGWTAHGQSKGQGWTAHGQSKGQGLDCPRTVKGAGVGLPTDSQRGRGWTVHGQSKGQGVDCPRTVKGAGVGLPTDSQRGRGWTAHGQSKGQGLDCPRTVKGAGVGLPTDSQRGRGWTAHGQSKGQGLDCPRTVKGAGVGLPTDSQRSRGWTAHGQSKGQGLDCPRTVKGAGGGLSTDSQSYGCGGGGDAGEGVDACRPNAIGSCLCWIHAGCLCSIPSQSWAGLGLGLECWAEQGRSEYDKTLTLGSGTQSGCMWEMGPISATPTEPRGNLTWRPPTQDICNWDRALCQRPRTGGSVLSYTRIIYRSKWDYGRRSILIQWSLPRHIDWEWRLSRRDAGVKHIYIVQVGGRFMWTVWTLLWNDTWAVTYGHQSLPLYSFPSSDLTSEGLRILHLTNNTVITLKRSSTGSRHIKVKTLCLNSTSIPFYCLSRFFGYPKWLLRSIDGRIIATAIWKMTIIRRILSVHWHITW